MPKIQDSQIDNILTQGFTTGSFQDVLSLLRDGELFTSNQLDKLIVACRPYFNADALPDDIAIATYSILNAGLLFHSRQLDPSLQVRVEPWMKAVEVLAGSVEQAADRPTHQAEPSPPSKSVETIDDDLIDKILIEGYGTGGGSAFEIVSFLIDNGAVLTDGQVDKILVGLRVPASDSSNVADAACSILMTTINNDQEAMTTTQQFQFGAYVVNTYAPSGNNETRPPDLPI